MIGSQHRRKAKQVSADYLRAFEKLLNQMDVDAVERVVQRLRVARDSGAMIYMAGNRDCASLPPSIIEGWIGEIR